MSKRITILGAGESGVGAALLAHARGYEVMVSDNGEIKQQHKVALENEGIEFEEMRHSTDKILTSELVVKSPGIPDSLPLILSIKEKNIPVISEIEFAYKYCDTKFIAVTGSNGKTTTTLLIYHILKEAGTDVGLAGNVGDSLAKQVIGKQKAVYVLELSSFQLDGVYDFKADIAVLLNITPDHMDRYENRFDKYVDSKFRITRNMTASDSFIYNGDDPVLQQEVLKRDIEASKLPVSVTSSLSRGGYVNGNKLTFKNGVSFSIPIETLPLKGTHNYINTMSAVWAALKYGIDQAAILEAIKTFKNAPHRLELVDTINGIQFVNDSKATNVDAVKYALDSFASPIVWIVGGVDKGNDYSQVMELVSNNVKAIVCLGKDNTKIKKAFGHLNLPIAEAASAEEATTAAYKFGNEGDVVLLSPACASFDLFSNYVDRGDQFKAAVSTLKKGVKAV